MNISIFRFVCMFAALALCIGVSVHLVFAQDVGADIGGAAGIFRPKNPETAKRTSRTPAGPRRATPTRTAGPTSAEVEDILEKGNEFRDARRFAEAEAAYKNILKIRPKDGRAAYGLGNVYSDQQRWEEAETSYRNALLWSPSDVDA
jgi:tetratricopeptide (TPR) repeat protein